MIDKYFTQTMEVWDKGVTNVQGVVKEVPVLLDTFLGILDKAPTGNQFVSDKDTFVYTNVLFTSINSNIVEDTIIKYDENVYDVVSVIDPLYRNNHLEILLNRRS